MANPPGYISANSMPVIPTGYEALEQQAAHKRALANALLQSGLQGPGDNAHSWTQLLGSLAQTFAGTRLNKQADNTDASIRSQQLGHYNSTIQNIQKDMQDGMDVGGIAQKYGGDPMVQQYVKPLVDAYSKQLETQAVNRNTVGDPTIMNGPDGRQTVMLDKAGGVHQLSGGLSKPEEISNVNGVATALQAQQPGTMLAQDPSALVIRDPTGHFAQNIPAIQAKTQIAKAGAPSISTVLNNNMDKAIDPVIAQDLQKTRENADAAVQMLPDISRAREALKKGVITGYGANVRLDLARFGQFLGVTGKNENEVIANSQVLLQSLGRQMLPILQALRPASDTDVKTAQMMSGGDLNLTPQAIQSAIDSAEKAAYTAIDRHNKKVDNISRLYTGPVGNSIQTFKVERPATQAPEVQNEYSGKSTGDLAAEAIARRNQIRKQTGR